MRTLATLSSTKLVAPVTAYELQEYLLTKPQVEAPVIHSFGPGIYIREVTLKAGTVAVGHHQNFEHQNIVLNGHVRMLRDDGTTLDVVGPTMFVGKPGKKAGYVIKDTVWLNIYSTEERDIEKLEAHFLTKDPTWIDSQARKRAADSFIHNADREDYETLLIEFNISKEQARREAEYEMDQIPFPMGSYCVKLGDSPIEGKGLFATANFQVGGYICPGRLDWKRTPAGRFTNHSKSPNAEPVLEENGDIHFVAIKPIAGCRGGSDGEEITIDYRKALILNNRKPLCLV